MVVGGRGFTFAEGRTVRIEPMREGFKYDLSGLKRMFKTGQNGKRNAIAAE